MLIETSATPELVTHVVFDPGSGRILGTLRHDPEPGPEVRDEGAPARGTPDRAEAVEACRCHVDAELLASFLRPGMEQGPLPQLAALPPDAPARLDALRVDPATRGLRPLPRLVVDPERTVLEGDGEDAVTIQIRAVDDQGAVLEDFSGEVHVQTGRGKLSTRGGVVRLEGGRASVRLTSVAETVDAVPVVVRAPDGLATPARASLIFE